MKIAPALLGLSMILPAAWLHASQPNIILIFTDDHGYADLGCQGIFDDVKTPHIDKLAATGARMTNGYTTAPQCVPSRGGVLSGQFIKGPSTLQ